MKIMDIPDWPPNPGGAFDSTYRSPRSEEAIVKRIESGKGTFVTFVCESGGKEHSYDLDAKSADLRGKVEKVFRTSIGKSLMEMGFLEIDNY